MAIFDSIIEWAHGLVTHGKAAVGAAPVRQSAFLSEMARLDAEAVLGRLNTHSDGLTIEDAEARLVEHGPNLIAKERTRGVIRLLLERLINPLNLMLLVLVIVNFFVLDDMESGTIVSTMVVLSVTLSFLQEHRSSKAAEKLRAMVSTTATVLRREPGEHPDDPLRAAKIEMPISELVPGDVIALSAGDIIPADVRILTARDLFINQSSLTGESLPLEKFPALTNPESSDPLALSNLCFMGSHVTSGTARAVVVQTGAQTYFGTLAKAIVGQRVSTSFEKGINRFTWMMIRFMLVMVPLVFVINGFTKGNWMEAFVFAMAVAVGLTPEMLPMIVTVNLSKGALAMSRKKVIVKRLNSIQNFGAMDVLCTDKTGTLTQDKVIMKRHVNLLGDDCDEVLQYAFLNSYYQSGLKNLLDVAVLDHVEVRQDLHIDQSYAKIDEIPFDFVRRRMSVVVAKEQAQHVLICKGAVEEILSICTHGEINQHNETESAIAEAYIQAEEKGYFPRGTDADSIRTRLISGKDETHSDGVEQSEQLSERRFVFPLDSTHREAISKLTQELNEDGFRVVAVAHKDMPPEQNVYTVADECGLTLIGFIAFLDPPKDSAAQAIAALENYGVAVKILTGDNEIVTRKICKEVNLTVFGTLLGGDIENMTDDELAWRTEHTTIFAKLSPTQKARVIAALHRNGHVVGFLGDGINDGPALKAADVGVSVDTAVDIAKESADIILLEKSLLILEEGVIEGRKVFGNITKYIKMGASSNFGNMFSMLGASALLPFLPMAPVQVLTNNLLYDFSQTAIPTDHIDEDYLRKPRKWDIGNIAKFMMVMGPISSIFDYATFALMYYVFKANAPEHASLFQTGWFVESLLSQTLIIHIIRTHKIPFLESRASLPLILTSLVICAIGVWLPFSPFAASLGFAALPGTFWFALTGILVAYMMLAHAAKLWFIKRFGWN